MDASVFCTPGQTMLPLGIAARARPTHLKDLSVQCGQPMLPVAAKGWFKLQDYYSSRQGKALAPGIRAGEPEPQAASAEAEARRPQGAAMMGPKRCPRDKGRKGRVSRVRTRKRKASA